jgi:hypothetical protein
LAETGRHIRPTTIILYEPLINYSLLRRRFISGEMLSKLSLICYVHLSLGQTYYQADLFDASGLFHAMVARTTIVRCRYIMLAVQKRIHDDTRTLGVMFYSYCEEIRDIRFPEMLSVLMELLQKHLQRHLPVENIREFISIFIASLPLFFRARLQFFEL